METPETFTLSVDVAVIESLGTNLYSNAAAVLAELVANAWDADAGVVTVCWTDTDHWVQDDGSGMTIAEMNDRFLTVGYKKREVEGDQSPSGRRFMGRKGIGKLSVFSIADEVEVWSRKDGVCAGFKMPMADMRSQVTAGQAYHPAPVQPDESVFVNDAGTAVNGTRITLRRLRTNRAGITATALRRRIARRFNIMAAAEHGFTVRINQTDVTHKDRDDLKRIEYIWEFGTPSIADADEHGWPLMPKLRTNGKFTLPGQLPGHPDWQVDGWIGTVTKPSELEVAEDDESLRNIIVLARGRPIQEGILDKLRFNKVFANYVTGEIIADFLDTEESDVATSDRQRLIEDDPRVTALMDFLRASFDKAAERWSEARKSDRFKDTVAEYPWLDDWVRQQQEYEDSARKLIGTVMAADHEDESETKQLLKSTIISFARLRLTHSFDTANQLAAATEPGEAPAFFDDFESYQATAYRDLIDVRLAAINALEEFINNNSLEKVLQRHLYKNMWMLDPGWEAATELPEMEETLQRFARAKGSTVAIPKPDDRMDIRYMNTAGETIIIELKRYDRRVTLDELRSQGEKYYNAVITVLADQQAQAPNAPRPRVQVVFVVGPNLDVGLLGTFDSPQQKMDHDLEGIHGRVVKFDQLLTDAKTMYRQFIERTGTVTDLQRLLAQLD